MIKSFAECCKAALLDDDPDPRSHSDRVLGWTVLICVAGILLTLAVGALLS